MKEFRIGQRVRIISAKLRPEFLGCVATIVSGECKKFRSIGHEIDIEGAVWFAPARCLEPIDDNTGDWRVIEHVTKWNPYKVNA